jgi:trans-aconitate methyltransferase
VSAASFRALARAAAARYPARDPFARHFAYGKLTGDPVFRYLVEQGLVPAHSRVLDLGCGQGLLAALLAQSFDPAAITYRGIDLGARDIERARHAASAAEFVCGDIRSVDFGAADVVVILDVLHYVDAAAQEDVLRRVRVALDSGGTLVMRIADASSSLRFRWTLAADKLATWLRGRQTGDYHCRSLAEWQALLAGLGFAVEAIPMSEGTPFANVLLVGRYDD